VLFQFQPQLKVQNRRSVNSCSEGCALSIQLVHCSHKDTVLNERRSSHPIAAWDAYLVAWSLPLFCLDPRLPYPLPPPRGPRECPDYTLLPGLRSQWFSFWRAMMASVATDTPCSWPAQTGQGLSPGQLLEEWLSASCVGCWEWEDMGWALPATLPGSSSRSKCVLLGTAGNGAAPQLLCSHQHLPLPWPNWHVSLEVARKLMKPDSYETQRSIKACQPVSGAHLDKDGGHKKAHSFGPVHCLLFGRAESHWGWR
jgi:hypothetical protein